MKFIISAAFAVVLATTFTAFGAEPDTIPPPPWLMTNTHGIELGYALDEATVRKLLPKGVEPVKEITGGFEMYTSPDGFGISPYSAFLFFVDVEGMDMPDGRKGRWVLQGFYGSDAVATALREHYGWPIQAGGTRIEQKGDTLVFTGMVGGRDVMEVRLRRASKECEWHNALDYWSGKPANGPVLINPIPNSLCLREVEVTGMTMRAAGDAVVAALQPGAQPLAYAVEWENGAWSFTKPVPLR